MGAGTIHSSIQVTDEEMGRSWKIFEEAIENKNFPTRGKQVCNLLSSVLVAPFSIVNRTLEFALDFFNIFMLCSTDNKMAHLKNRVCRFLADPLHILATVVSSIIRIVCCILGIISSKLGTQGLVAPMFVEALAIKLKLIIENQFLGELEDGKSSVHYLSPSIAKSYFGASEALKIDHARRAGSIKHTQTGVEDTLAEIFVTISNLDIEKAQLADILRDHQDHSRNEQMDIWLNDLLISLPSTKLQRGDCIQALSVLKSENGSLDSYRVNALITQLEKVSKKQGDFYVDQLTKSKLEEIEKTSPWLTPLRAALNNDKVLTPLKIQVANVCDFGAILKQA